ncbi:MAG: putative rane protein [Acidimicrobiales bacterium]|nr:putative rane protein [Acidimicrobiales bacterium]
MASSRTNGVARVTVTSVPGPPELSKLGIFAAVVRRCGPHLIEATVVPAVVFYACLVAFGLGAAYVGALTWSYAALARRLVRHQAVPALLVLSVIGLTVRTLVAIVSHSSFLYFFQPVLATVAMGGVFLVSVGIGRPLIGRLADEFWPITEEMAVHPGVLRLFRDLTLLWAAVNLVSAALTLCLLVTLPIGAFVAVKQLSGLAISGGAVFLTISRSLATARREGFAAQPIAAVAP